MNIYVFTYIFTYFFSFTYFPIKKSRISLASLILNSELLTSELFSDSIILGYKLSGLYRTLHYYALTNY